MGIASTAIFGTRNLFKGVSQHDPTRDVVAGCQYTGLIDSVSGSDSSLFSNISKSAGKLLGHADKPIESFFEKVGRSDVLDDIVKSTGANTKIGAIAQKAVNPLLCAGAGYRVLKDDDQYAALIEETAAMSTMFGCESAMKYVRSEITGGIQAEKGFAGKIAKTLSKSKTLNDVLGKASKWFENLGKSPKGNAKQTLAKIGIDLLFVCGSVLSYSIGHKAGQAVSNREQ